MYGVLKITSEARLRGIVCEHLWCACATELVCDSCCPKSGRILSCVVKKGPRVVKVMLMCSSAFIMTCMSLLPWPCSSRQQCVTVSWAIHYVIDPTAGTLTL